MEGVQLALPGFDESYPPQEIGKTALIPSPSAFGVPMSLDAVLKSGQGLAQYVDMVAKSLTAPPGVYNFGQLQTLPDPNAEGVIAWPGLPPETLRKMAATLLAPKIIIQSRVNDVLAYSQFSPHPWKKGWAIEMCDARASPSEATLRRIREAEQFILNCNSEYGSTEARKRDSMKYYNFAHFLALITRDSFTYDGIAVYTDMDRKGRVKGFTPLPAGNIRLAGTGGYRSDPEKYAVLVDEGGTIYRSFTRDELLWVVRNPRTDATVGGYGLSELDAAAKLVDGIENALELNIDVFSKNGIPQGMLKLKGLGWTNRELDLITRMWNNLKKGITKAWALPAMVMPPECDIEFMDLNYTGKNEGMFQEFINMMMGVYCTICNYPVNRLGFRISGRINEPRQPGESAVEIFKEEDLGLTVFLQLLENTINNYLLWSRYPDLRFVFRAKSPKEDAREYEIRQMAQTYGERRAATDNKPLTSVISSEGNKKEMSLVADLMSLAPTDPGMAGIYQTIAGAVIKAKLGVPSGPGGEGGARIQPKKDPAESAAHGHASGIRRDSAKES